MCKFGDIYMAAMNLPDYVQPVRQPVMVVSADKINKISSIVNVVPIVNAAEQYKRQSYVFIGSYGISEKNIVVIEQINTLNQTQLLVKIGSVRGTVYADQVRQEIKSYLCL